MATNPQKIPKIVNILNTNIIYKPQSNNQQQPPEIKSTARIANSISIHKLQKLLAQNFTNIVGPESANNKKPRGLELLGKGINGTIYKINHPDQDYFPGKFGPT